MQTAKKILVVMVMILSFVSLANRTKADEAPPSTQTTFYFQKDGKPFVQPIKFTIKCYGQEYNRVDDTYSEIMRISEFSEACQSYGCKFDTTGVFEPHSAEIKYCNVDGETNGNKFTINNFLVPSTKSLDCYYVYYNFDGMEADKYYKETPEYKKCIDSNADSCEKYLAEVPKPDKSAYGDPYQKLCEAKVNIPSGTSANQSSQNSNDTATGISDDSSSQNQNAKSASLTQNPENKNIFTGILDSFKNLFLDYSRNRVSLTYGAHFLLSLLFTLIIEILTLLLAAKYLLKLQVPTKEIIWWSIFANLLSLPYLWFVLPLFISSYNYILIGEILVVSIEAIILWKALKINLKNAFILSLTANLASYLAGIILLR